MKTIHCNYQSERDLQELKQQAEGIPHQSAMIQVFAGTVNKSALELLVEQLSNYFVGVPFIGTTSGGEILSDQVSSSSMLVCLSLFQHGSVNSTYVDCQNSLLADAGRHLADEFVNDETDCLILFSAGLTGDAITNSEPLLKTINGRYPSLVIAGGQSAAEQAGETPLIFDASGVYDHGVVALSISNPDLKIATKYNLSWIPVGKQMRVTKAQGSRIMTLDNSPAVEVYRYYLGHEVANKLPHSATDFPLVMERNGVLVARHANHVFPDGSLDMMSNFQEGELVRFAYCHAGFVEEDAKALYNKLCFFEPETTFIYSCIARKWILGNEVETELEHIAKLSPCFGFFSFGEYYSNGSNAQFLTQSMTTLSFREGDLQDHEAAPKPMNASSTGNNQERHYKSIRVLHHLIERSTKDLEAANKELELLAETDQLSGLANRRKLLYELKREVLRARRTRRPLSVLMMDIDHFKEYNDRYGHVAGDMQIKLVAKTISEIISRQMDLAARYGGEEFCSMLPLTSFSDALHIAEKIRVTIEEMAIPHNGIGDNDVMTMSIGVTTIYNPDNVTEYDVIDLADKQLYIAKQSGRNRVSGSEYS